jgi:hypothetical protein
MIKPASHMARASLPLLATACLGFGALAQPAWAAKRHSSTANTFRARIAGGLGLVPPVNRQGQLSTGDVATGALTPETYHGGPVMAGGVTVHTIFWAPQGHPFQGSPGGGVPTYVGLVQQFLTDVAADSGAPGTCTPAECNAFTVQRQYAEGTGVGQITPGAYSISYNAADSINDSNPYPAKADQCASPAGTAVCVTDGEIQSEIDRVIQSTPGTPRGLNNLWFVFLPPGVDECIDPGSCGTNSFAGYHSVSNVNGHGVTIYALSIDPIIEVPVPPGADPQGFPDAEVTIDIAGHEVNEAMADPEGNGWMDPNGFEVADKCDIGPQTGTPLGFAPDGSPYNQVINGHQYLLQEEWANVDSSGDSDCVQATTTTTNQLPLPQVNLRQFNPVVSGNVNTTPGGGLGVQVSLLRTGPNGTPVVVARGSTSTASDGTWSVSLAPHAPGDDRDEIIVDYSGPGAPTPHRQVILTGNGGNPFTEAGWTGWLAMDAGSAQQTGAGGSSLSLAPCFQAGTLTYTLNGASAAQSPNDLCNTQTDVATESTPVVGRGDAVKWISNDNRAFDAPNAPNPNPLGGLVSLTVPVGEPGSVSTFTGGLTTFTPGGFPSCTADLEFQGVACTGLVSGAIYALTDRGQQQTGRADATGTVVVPMLIQRGDAISLGNGSRVLTTLHVARLKVRILGDETFLSGGTCQPGEYFGLPLQKVPTTTLAGVPTNPLSGGVALTGQICPPSGHAGGLPSDNISQTDELSGGQTETEVPDIADTSPMEGETMYGRFTALAESAFALSGGEALPSDAFTRIALKISTPRGATVLKIRNVDTARGAPVPALRPGNYIATWTLTDVNRDTRVIETRFIEQRGRVGPGPRAKVACSVVAGPSIRCSVSFPGGHQIHGTLRIRLTRGGSVVALGHGRVRRGRATVTMRELRPAGAGSWVATLVLSRPHIEPVTIRVRLKSVT